MSLQTDVLHMQPFPSLIELPAENRSFRRFAEALRQVFQDLRL